MTTRGIVSGALQKPPLQKTSANGNAYLLATIRDGSGDGARWWSAFVFNQDDITRVADLQAGDPLAVAGEIDASLYTPKDGQPRVSFSIRVDGVLTARKPPREPRDAPARKGRPAARETAREAAARSWAAPNRGDGPDDAIPF